MLPLDSPRWAELATPFDTSEALPDQIRGWLAAVGTSEEADCWSDLEAACTHQLSMYPPTYAILPYVVQVWERIPPTRRLDYLVFAGFVVAESGDYVEYVPDLAPACFAAVEQLRHYAAACLAPGMERTEFRRLLSAISGLHGQPKFTRILFFMECVSGECPVCGEHVYPDDLQAAAQ